VKKRNDRNQADKVAEQRNHGSYKQIVRPKTDLAKLTHRKGGGHEFVQIARPLWASGHGRISDPCPLYPRKPTSFGIRRGGNVRFVPLAVGGNL
jgi:hypothetical protein